MNLLLKSFWFATETNGARPVLSATRLLERRRAFHQNLLEIVKGHHKVSAAFVYIHFSLNKIKLCVKNAIKTELVLLSELNHRVLKSLNGKIEVLI